MIDSGLFLIADESEIVTTVNCTIGGPRSETIEGVYDKKWEFMRNSCPRNVSLHIRITKVELCNNPEPVEEHAILVIESKNFELLHITILMPLAVSHV